MSRISGIQLIEQPGFFLASVRRTIDFMEEYAAFAADAFGRVSAHIEARGGLPGGAPLVSFHNTDLARLDLEAGFPLAGPLPADGDVLVREIPRHRAVVAIDQGPYEAQDPTLIELMAFVEAHRLEMDGDIWYQYLNETDRPEDEYLTRMVIPVR